MSSSTRRRFSYCFYLFCSRKLVIWRTLGPTNLPFIVIEPDDGDGGVEFIVDDEPLSALRFPPFILLLLFIELLAAVAAILVAWSLLLP